MLKRYRGSPPGGYGGWKYVSDLCPWCRYERVYWKAADKDGHYWCRHCGYAWTEPEAIVATAT